MVDVEQDALRALKKDWPALGHGVREQRANVRDVRPEFVARGQRSLVNFAGIHRVDAETMLKQDVLLIERSFNFVAKQLGPQQVASHYATPSDLVLVRRA